MGFFIIACISYPLLLFVTAKALPKGLRTNLLYNHEGIGYTYTRFKDADTVKNVDIMVMGSSHAYRGYDPRIFSDAGYRIFNLGSSAQTPLQTEYLLKRYLKQFSPKFVILDVYPSLFGSDGVESTSDLLSNSEIDDHLLELATSHEDIRIYNTLFYSLLINKLGLAPKTSATLGSQKEGTYVKGGYVSSNKIFKPSRSIKRVNYNMSDKQIASFERTVNSVKRSNLPYIIIQAPIPQEVYKNVMNIEEVDAKLSKYGPYINANEYLSLPDTCFYDNSHLNQRGVEIFNRFVLDKINEIKKLKVANNL